MNNHLPETKANVPMPEVKPCKTSLDDEILKILDKHNKEILGVVKEEIIKKYNDRPSSYNHPQRIEFYNDVMKIIGNHICENAQFYSIPNKGDGSLSVLEVEE